MLQIQRLPVAGAEDEVDDVESDVGHPGHGDQQVLEALQQPG